VVDPDTKEKYALKQISMLQGGRGIENEMAVLLNKNLQHINIVRYFTFFQDNELINIVMEFCEERNLEIYANKRIQRKATTRRGFLKYEKTFDYVLCLNEINNK
jgi:serine/threonine protein kinase